MAGKKRIGIVLFQLGGPDSLEAVEPFGHEGVKDMLTQPFVGEGLDFNRTMRV